MHALYQMTHFNHILERLESANVNGNTLTAADAGAGDAILLAGGFELARKSVGDAHARSAERVTNRGRTAPDVQATKGFSE